MTAHGLASCCNLRGTRVTSRTRGTSRKDLGRAGSPDRQKGRTCAWALARPIVALLPEVLLVSGDFVSVLVLQDENI